MDGAAAVEQHRTGAHLGAHRTVPIRDGLVAVAVRTRDDAGGTRFHREVGERPHGGQLHLDLVGEREEIEAPLVAVQGLGGGAGADGDELAEVQLERRLALPQEPLGDVEHQRVADESVRGGGPGDERAGAAGGPAGEVVGAGRRGLEVGRHLPDDPGDGLR